MSINAASGEVTMTRAVVAGYIGGDDGVCVKCTNTQGGSIVYDSWVIKQYPECASAYTDAS